MVVANRKRYEMSKKLRKVNTKKSKKKVIIIVLIVLIILGLGGYFGYKSFFGEKKKKVNVKVVDSIEKYGYSINDRDTEYYKKEFAKLKKLLNSKNIDEKEYATEVARLFVIDLYTMSSKVNKYDVGGREYFYNTKVDMYDLKVMDTIYNTMKDDTYGDRKQELPEITEVETESVKESTYRFIETVTVDPTTGQKSCREGFEISKNDNNKCVKDVDKVYVVELLMNYKEDLDYDIEASVVVAKEEDSNRWSVVEYKPELGAFED